MMMMKVVNQNWNGVKSNQARHGAFPQSGSICDPCARGADMRAPIPTCTQANCSGAHLPDSPRYTVSPFTRGLSGSFDSLINADMTHGTCRLEPQTHLRRAVQESGNNIPYIHVLHTSYVLRGSPQHTPECLGYICWRGHRREIAVLDVWLVFWHLLLLSA